MHLYGACAELHSKAASSLAKLLNSWHWTLYFKPCASQPGRALEHGCSCGMHPTLQTPLVIQTAHTLLGEMLLPGLLPPPTKSDSCISENIRLLHGDMKCFHDPMSALDSLHYEVSQASCFPKAATCLLSL